MSSSFSYQLLEIDKRLMFLIFRVYRFFVEIAFFLDCTTAVLTDLRYLLEWLIFEVCTCTAQCVCDHAVDSARIHNQEIRLV